MRNVGWRKEVIKMGGQFAEWLYQKLESLQKKPATILYNSAVREDLQTLEPTGDIPNRQKKYVIQKLSLCSVIVICGVVMSIIMWIKDQTEIAIVDNQIVRSEYGDGEKAVTLIAEDMEHRYQIPLTISERCYSQDELMQMSDEASVILERSILGENQSFDEIQYDLNLVSKVAGYPFSVEWRTDEMYLDDTGRLVQDKLSSPILTELTAILSCESFETEYNMTVRIHSKAIQPGLEECLTRQLSDLEAQSREQYHITLPSEMADRTIRWHYKRRWNGLILLSVTPILAVLIFYGKDKDLHRQVMEREEQMRMDYPEIVSSLALLIGAGMTVPNAWNKIAKDYRKRRDGGAKKRFAYEEMLLTIYEMENGVVQAKAYERFGRRCRIPSYNKLATMLSQNIRKGAANLPQLLKEEAAEAFEERKHAARKTGEKAGTKLLVPMMLLLGITMVIIMVPALTSYL